MAQPDPREEPAQDHGITTSWSSSNGPSGSLCPVTETISDNDASEKPVREKLKKTSIASISQHAMNSQEITLQANDSGVARSPSGRRHSLSNQEDVNSTSDPSRGRPVKKRSYDNLEATEIEGSTNINNESSLERPNGHARKRSRDIRTGEPLKGDRQLHAVGITEEEEEVSNERHTPESIPANSGAGGVIVLPCLSQMEVEGRSSDNDFEQRFNEVSAEEHIEFVDQEMGDPTTSPRKKRSRDQFDTEADREQKIPATEEARAQRRSDELERKDATATIGETATLPEVLMPPEYKPMFAQDDAISTKTKSEAAQSLDPISPGKTPMPGPSASNCGNPSPTHDSANPQSNASIANFATSGFAAHSSSATSPFGILGAPSTPTGHMSSFASSATTSPPKTESFGAMEAKRTGPAKSSGFSTFARTSTSTFSTAEPSPFQSSTTSVFGGSAFGGAFGSGLGRGSKLTNFAAPNGDAKLGSANGAIKAIGSPTREDDEDDNSEDEDAGSGENENHGVDEMDGRFQHKDVETGEDHEITKLSSRASLYAFRDKTWKEGGKGTFKFNVNESSQSDPEPRQISGRFIMRAHQTFRVLLNAPILKKMTLGDSQGNEPSGKSFSFGVVEDGTLVPYLLKLSDATESKTLYREVRDLQESMPEG